VYTDDGIAGDEIERRKEFCRMLRDAKAGLFDVIRCDDKDGPGFLGDLEDLECMADHLTGIIESVVKSEVKEDEPDEDDEESN
jgi:hypothetical protein